MTPTTFTPVAVKAPGEMFWSPIPACPISRFGAYKLAEMFAHCEVVERDYDGTRVAVLVERGPSVERGR